MKKILSMLLALTLTVSLVPTARGSEAAVPFAPSWVSKESYLVFPGDPVYAPENWARVLAQREAAEQGGLLDYEGRDWAQGSPGECYETALIRLKCAENYGQDEFEAKAAFLSAGRAFSAAASGWYDQNRGRDETYYRLTVEKYRAYVLYHPAYSENLGRGLLPALDHLGMELVDFFTAPYMDRVGQEEKDVVIALVAEAREDYQREKDRVSVTIDGASLLLDTAPQIKSQRVMVPIRAIAEALGADVVWDGAARILMDRGDSRVTLQLGSPQAQVNGETVEMDVAPYADGNRTYVSARYVSEFFGQSVVWNGEDRRVEITETKSREQTQAEEWLLSLGALLGFVEGGDPTQFGFYPRPAYTETGLPGGNETVLPRDLCRELLAEDWSIGSREELLSAVHEILETGHDSAFQEAAKEIRNLSDGEIARRAKRLGEVDEYMWPYTKELWEKWHKTGIRGWDLGRCATLCRWGYTAGYLTYSEAIELLDSAVQEVRERFTSWDRFYENFLEGYYWCVREDLGDSEIWDTQLGKTYLYLKNAPETRALFSNAGWESRT